MFSMSFLIWAVLASQSVVEQATIAPPSQLDAWRSGIKTERVECEFTRYCYDHNFSVARIGTGRIVVDRKLGTRLELNPGRNVPCRLPRDSEGVDFRVVQEESSTWIFTDEWVLECQPHDRKAFRIMRSSQKMNRSVETSGLSQSVVNWFRVADDAVACCRGGFLADDELISFLINAKGAQVTVKKNLTIISAVATGPYTRNFSQVRVAFTAGNDFPDSIRMTAPGQASETVYVFRDIQTGPSDAKSNPAEIDLSDYEVHELN